MFTPLQFSRGKARNFSLAAALVVSLSVVSPSVWAQPGGPPPSGQSSGQRGGQDDRMAQEMAKKQADALRKTLKKFGYKDKALQDAIVEYAQGQQAARMPLQMATMQLARSVKDKNASEDQVRQSLDRLRQTTAEERRRRAEMRDQRLKSESDLDARIGFSKNARLEATLVMMGILGDETEMLAGAAPGFESEVSASQDAPNAGGRSGGMGGRGGGMGGGGMGGMGGGMPNY